MLGSVETTRVTEGSGAFIDDEDADRVESSIRAELTPEEWNAAYDRGRGEPVADLMRTMAALSMGSDLRT